MVLGTLHGEILVGIGALRPRKLIGPEMPGNRGKRDVSFPEVVNAKDVAIVGERL